MIRRLLRSPTQRVMSLTLLGMLMGLAMDVLLAARFGAGRDLDALVIALTLPQFVDNVTREGTKFSLIPVLIRGREAQDEAAYQRYVSGLLNAGIVLGLVLALSTLVLAPWFVAALGPGLSHESRESATALLRLAVPTLAVAPPISLLTALLNSQGRFQLVALRNALAPGAVVIALLAGWGSPLLLRWVALAFGLGVVVFGVLLFARARRDVLRYQPRAWPTRADAASVRSALSFPTVGVLVGQGSRVAERQIASLIAPGGVSMYYLAFRLFSSMQRLVGMPIATTSLPGLVRIMGSGDRARFDRAWRRHLVRALALSLPVALVTALFPHEITRLVFSRGEFDPELVRTTASILFWFALGLAVDCLQPVLQSAAFALEAYRIVGLSKILAALVKVALALVLARGLGLGLPGIAMAVSLATVFGAAYVLVFLVRRPRLARAPS